MATSPTDDISKAALAFRGYNITNLGRTAELLAVDAYRPIVAEELQRFSTVCNDYTDWPVALMERVQRGEEPQLDQYAEAIALVVATEVAQLRLLGEVHCVDVPRAKMAYGYSLGELTAVSVGGLFLPEDMVRIPLSMAADCAAMAANVTMGVLFSRGPAIDPLDVERLCLQISNEGAGTIGISAVLSPNTFLLIGQDETVERFTNIMHDLLPHRAHMRINEHRWPPLHTPIVRQRNVPDRASVMMETIRGGFAPPCPPVFSLVTGDVSYDDHSTREILRKWVDHPQLLWEAVYATLSQGVETVIHVGPTPNVIPATFQRLSENVLEQTSEGSLGGFGLRAVSGLARRPWLAALLPSQAAILRAPYLKHVILEDWLLDNPPA